MRNLTENVMESFLERIQKLKWCQVAPRLATLYTVYPCDSMPLFVLLGLPPLLTNHCLQATNDGITKSEKGTNKNKRQKKITRQRLEASSFFPSRVLYIWLSPRLWLTHSASLSLVFFAPFHHRIYTTQLRGDLSDWLWILVEPLAMNMATGLEAAVGK